METISSCRICESENIVKFFDLGNQPLANSLLKKSEDREDYYPLSLSFCQDCSLMQLDQTIEPKKLFSQYVWVTGTSKTASTFAEDFYEKLVSRTLNPESGYVLELASNDGTFLKPFIRNGFTAIGLDPAQNICEEAEKNGVPTICDYWGSDSASRLLKERGPARIIFARNVLPHVANTKEFVRSIAECIHPDGTVAIEVHYAKTILEGLHYDSIYHEHLCYFTFKSLERLLNQYNLHVFDIQKSPISGGSIIVYATREKKREEQPIVRIYREGEQQSKTNDLTSWIEFAKRSFEHREILKKTIHEYINNGERIVGWGASARSSTMLNFCGITSDILPVIADQSPLKQGLYTAGTHILVEDPTCVMERNPSCVFILAWNFSDEIIESLEKRYNFTGNVIIPLPISLTTQNIESGGVNLIHS